MTVWVTIALAHHSIELNAAPKAADSYHFAAFFSYYHQMCRNHRSTIINRPIP
jgi:hypothetical protein